MYDWYPPIEGVIDYIPHNKLKCLVMPAKYFLQATLNMKNSKGPKA